MNEPSSSHEHGERPPAYGDAEGTVAPEVDLAASFAKLSLPSGPADPSRDVCLAHLKLLHALQAMKEDVGYTDGLWNMWDSRADGKAEDLVQGSSDAQGLSEEDRKKLALSKLREKRWALFVARAVDRYEAWWRSLPHAMLTEEDMALKDHPKYSSFERSAPTAWGAHMLPPLDVLMVFHAHMLNPRALLEDTMRYGMGGLWAAGMPWHQVNEAIDVDCNYEASAEAKRRWTATTGRSWANQDDGLTKRVKCAFCSRKFDVLWTTCGMDEGATASRIEPGITGSGFGDGRFSHSCPACGRENYKELLSVFKFVQDAALLLSRSVPMPGTLLDPQTGCPDWAPSSSPCCPRTFPNRMIRLDLRIKIVELLQPGGVSRPTMETAKAMIEETMLDNGRVRKIDYNTSAYRRYRLPAKSRVCVRKMMSRYWENFSSFALDLGGAVMRQSIFVDKMCKLDWLHSPSASDTMQRLITKYGRFMAIITSHPSKVAVPTLDVDLAWHTHQLSPSAYYRHSVSKTGRFIDHDDKIDESKLSAAFEWTTKTYQDMFGEVYSECTCWYCEAIRSAHISTVGSLLRMSKGEKIAESFHSSGAAKLCPPDNSAHVSAHNAVRSLETAARQRVTKQLRRRHDSMLTRNYLKAEERAHKKGRKLPRQDEFYNHWGYSFFMYSPYMYPAYFAPGIYSGSEPGYVHAGNGAWANCAAGTCGTADAGVGGCGGAGACGDTGFRRHALPEPAESAVAAEEVVVAVVAVVVVVESELSF